MSIEEILRVLFRVIFIIKKNRKRHIFINFCLVLLERRKPADWQDHTKDCQGWKKNRKRHIFINFCLVLLERRKPADWQDHTKDCQGWHAKVAGSQWKAATYVYF